MTDETFNGWTNRESWLVSLWLDNEQGTHERCREIAAACESDLAAGEAIERAIDEGELFGELPVSGFLADLVNGALARVDWRAIGNHFREE